MKIGDENIEKIVLASTKSLLQNYGVKGWNMDDLAKDCGMSKRTLYKIIGNKEDLLYRCHADGIDGNIKSLTEYVNQDKDYYSLLDNLSDLVINGIEEFVIAGSKVIRTEYPQISAMIDEKVDRFQKILVDFMERGKVEGYLLHNLNPTTISNIISALMKHSVTNSKNKSEFDTNIKEQLDFLFFAIRKHN